MDFENEARGRKPLERIYQLTSTWRDETADQVYTLTVLGEYPDGERRVLAKYDGDAEWAGRIAAHYDIEMPKEDK